MAASLKALNSVGKNFYKAVQSARRPLVAFAKAKSARFSLRYKPLHIGTKRCIFDETSQTGKDTA